MSKVITSPVLRWPGTVTLSDPLTFPQVIAWEHAIDAMRKLKSDPDARDVEFDYALLPGVCACVEKWELQGLSTVTAASFPATPRGPASKLLAWLIREITELYKDDTLPPD